MAKKKAEKKIEKTKADPKVDRITDIVAKINKAANDECTITLLTDDFIRDIPVNASGVLSIDEILGVGGYPHGRIIELFGSESSGKTTVCLHAIAAAQKAGGLCAFIDAEHALDVAYAAKLGVDVKKLMISQPMGAEAALDMVENLAGLLAGGDIIVIDSVAALTPNAELAGDMGASHMGLQARLMSQAMRKLTGIVSKTGVTVMFINQTRQKIGIVYGSNVTTCVHPSTKVSMIVD